MSSRSTSFAFEEENTQTPHRRVQWLFFSYRLLVSCLLAIIFFGLNGNTILGQHNPTLFGLTTTFYIAFVIAEGVLLSLRPNISFQSHTLITVFVDIVAIIFLMHASGGIQSGLGMLLAVSIAFSSLLMPGVAALLVAAIASLAVLTQQIYIQLFVSSISESYPQAGLLGASFFAIAILAHVLSRRLKESERLVSQKELDLANLEQLNEYIIRNMQTGILVVDDKLYIRLMNESAWHLIGMPDARPGHHLSQASKELSELIESWSDDPTFTPKPFIPLPKGREIKPGFSRLGIERNQGTVVFLEDITSVTQQAQQMKLASLGRLTASIAHEIRNPLSAISHAEQLLGESPDIADTDRRLLDIIDTHSKRVNNIIESVLSLSRRGRAQPTDIELRGWIEEFTQEFCSTKTLSDNTLHTSITPSSTIVRVDSTQLHQILTNLCENALLHATPQMGELVIRLIGGITRESGGPYLEISDNGQGIRQEILKQIFEPFFTTDNAGSGLGLYIAKELAETNRMRLEYVTKPDTGACFRISFPSYRILRPK